MSFFSLVDELSEDEEKRRKEPADFGNHLMKKQENLQIY
jgi:hypothetical protein